MPHNIDPDTFGFVVGDISRLIRSEMERRIADAGLAVTPGEGRTLANIARMGTVRQNVLAERMGVEAMTLSSYLDRLEARGLVGREPDPADRRAKLVSLTASADDVLLQIREIGEDIRADLSRGATPDEWNALVETLKRIRNGLVELRSGASDEGRAA
ncbi:winged helix-turn-helix transcriptional regulator [Nitratireductor mangrovi]|uniref:Winged helix-turn-helix transcriptional regulator n=1 Tax=Nitratireductor mangrovi TaxID=2599600 RepID=A0A5B8L1J6_9HYPH|nr:MarR family winged helix-turn-helix transcriptional regulator [Nitratireductor mangrovi]QDZ01781.1 winged helix-turn-helix transcriptional regulator [Nitratireductor mangrovi]